ncbi:MAG: YicC family protein [Eubacteriales bacterium]|nr:YicC family protein [Eubacteriales bacterium]MDD4460959.1 YicC family protein [Eubacteriales bacterium]
MALSMTGYGRGEVLLTDRRMLVEMKSVNNRYADFQIRLPRVLSSLESSVRQYLTRQISRGKIDVFINFTNLAAQSSQIICDTNLAAEYARALQQIGETIGTAWTPDAEAVARFPDVVRTESTEVDEDEMWQQLLEPALSQALDHLMSMRQTEGERLAEDIMARLDRLHVMCQEISLRAPEVPLAWRERLMTRIESLLGDKAAELFDEQRLAAEVAVFADKSAIDEELVRLGSHLEQFASILSSDGSIGKKLDFLVQEINREINTIGSKANDLHLTTQVVEMKSELEKIREQIQNIE